MRNRDKDKKFARKLTEISMDGQQVSAERVQAVLAYLRDRQPPRHRQVLVEYLHAVERADGLTRARVETAGTLNSASLAQIEKNLSERYGRPIHAESENNPELIAGVRIHIGDDVWDDTVAAQLETFAAAY